MTSQPSSKVDTVALFVTCLVDLFRPSIGFAAVKLLEDAGCQVVVPPGQTCCGQPAYNSGDRESAMAIAQGTILALEAHPAIVVPSGSCAGMLKRHYPELLADDMNWGPRARSLADRVFELTQYLAARGLRIDAQVAARATYHDSCSSLREMQVKEAPRDLISQVRELSLAEMAETEACCGFGGTFCVKFPDVSDAMAQRKVDCIRATGADLLLAGDLGCLLNLAGKLKRAGSTIAVRHVAEVLAGMTAQPAIGESGTGDSRMGDSGVGGK
ncbi:L-lactate dehydrogenase complex protein LldE [Dongia mobilis]|uniref:L-lactate dehydrogenase complex protein LldE n=1 Tax=Dongia mobilis TaxID=578943 RepID=A0A4R6WMX5_9PROT|nr:(Fe-S)-binding protein [Dongia mobilis]TDQ82253.1 L-lactate dehydrogenase complex protein LldE [Dongia mobilis]